MGQQTQESMDTDMTTTNDSEVFEAFLSANDEVDSAAEALRRAEAEREQVAAKMHARFGSGPYTLPDGRRFSLSKREAVRGAAGEESVKLDTPRYEVRFRSDKERSTIRLG